jgi:hypothetical protein
LIIYLFLNIRVDIVSFLYLKKNYWNIFRIEKWQNVCHIHEYVVVLIEHVSTHSKRQNLHNF